MKKEVFEANEQYNRSIEGLSSELDHADQLESRLRAVQNECSEACKNAEIAEAEKGNLGSGLQLGVRKLSNFDNKSSVQVRSKHRGAPSSWDHG